MNSSSQQKPKQKNCEFIDKLIDMMEKYPKFVYWTENGDELMISNLAEVQSKVLPDYFRHSNFASFVRQLNMYGFCKKEKNSEFLLFSHKIFRKDNNSQYYLIQRKAKTKNINKSSKFISSNNRLIEKLKTNSGLSGSAQQLTVNLLQYKQNMHDAMKRIKIQLDKLFYEFKDSRSKNVVQTLNFIKSQSYDSIVKSLTKAKQIDQCVSTQFTKTTFKNQTTTNDQQCSLQEQLPSSSGKQSDSQLDISDRFQVQQQQLSAFNDFQAQQ